MEELKPRIDLYVKRPFSDKMNVAFDFIKENWKPLLKYLTYLLLPLSLVQALSMNGFMSGYMAATLEFGQGGLDSILPLLPPLIANYSLLILCYWIGAILSISLLYALLQTYATREGRLQGITLREFRPLLTHNMVQVLKANLFMGLIMTVLVLIVGLLAALSFFTLLLTLPLLFACAVPLSLFVPIYLLESISLVEALKKTFRLGFATWGGVLLISLVMGIIASILLGVAGAPWTIAYVIKQVFSISELADVAATTSIGFGFTLYLFAILQSFGAYVSSILPLLGLAYQYGHASEVVDSVSVENDIENFDKL